MRLDFIIGVMAGTAIWGGHAHPAVSFVAVLVMVMLMVVKFNDRSG